MIFEFFGSGDGPRLNHIINLFLSLYIVNRDINFHELLVCFTCNIVKYDTSSRKAVLSTDWGYHVERRKNRQTENR